METQGSLRRMRSEDSGSLQLMHSPITVHRALTEDTLGKRTSTIITKVGDSAFKRDPTVRFEQLPSNKDRAVKEGYLDLFMQNSWLFMPHWHRYWFQLLDMCLYAFKSKDNRALVAVIPLEGSMVEKIPEADESNNRQNVYKFRVVTPSKEEYFLSTYTRHALNEWVETISRKQSRKMGLEPEERIRLDEFGERVMNLEDILYNEIALKAFSMFLEGEFSSENIEFWKQVQKYKSADEDEKSIIAQEIFHNHVFKNAPLQVNLPANIVKAISDKLLQQRFEDTLFAAAEKEICALMERDSLARFWMSPQGQMIRLMFRSTDGILRQTHLFKRSRKATRNRWLRYLPQREWQKRWCMLGVHSFVYFHSEEQDIDSATRVHGEIVFEDVSSIVDLGSTVVEGGKPHQFMLCHRNGEQVVFAAVDVESKFKWMEALNAVFQVNEALRGTLDSSPRNRTPTDKAYRTARRTTVVIADQADRPSDGVEEQEDIDGSIDEANPKRDTVLRILEQVFARIAQVHAEERVHFVTEAYQNRTIRIRSKDDPNDQETLVSDMINFSLTTAESVVRILDRVKRQEIEKEHFELAATIKNLYKMIEELADEVIQERVRARQRLIALRPYLTHEKWTQLTYSSMENTSSKGTQLSVCESLLRQFLGSVARRSPFKDTFMVQIENTARKLGPCAVCHKNITSKGLPKVVIMPSMTYKDMARISRDKRTPGQPDPPKKVLWAHGKCMRCTSCQQHGVSTDSWNIYFVAGQALCENCFNTSHLHVSPPSEEMDRALMSQGPDSPPKHSLKRLTMPNPLAKPDLTSISDVYEPSIGGPERETQGGGVDDITPITIDNGEEETAPLPEEDVEFFGSPRPLQSFGNDDDQNEEEPDGEEEELVDCAHCGRLISSATCISALDATWCPDHFRCSECLQAISLGDGYYIDDDRVYCPRCHKSHFFPTCHACGNMVDDGKVYSALGFAWHPECFACFTCHTEIGMGATFYEHDSSPYCFECYSRQFLNKCAECSQPIVGVSKSIGDRSWHPGCFRCSICARDLGDKSVFVQEGRIYCEEDHRALFIRACSVCGKHVSGMGRELGSTIYHVDCCKCAVCGEVIEAGTKLHMNDGQLLCHRDYLLKVCEQCAGCKEPIYRESVISALDKKWHKRCMVCAVCREEFDDGSPLYDVHGLPYCEKDYKLFLQGEQVIVEDSSTPTVEDRRSVLGIYSISGPPSPVSSTGSSPTRVIRSTSLPPPPQPIRSHQPSRSFKLSASPGDTSTDIANVLRSNMDAIGVIASSLPELIPPPDFNDAELLTPQLVDAEDEVLPPPLVEAEDEVLPPPLVDAEDEVLPPPLVDLDDEVLPPPPPFEISPPPPFPDDEDLPPPPPVIGKSSSRSSQATVSPRALTRISSLPRASDLTDHASSAYSSPRASDVSLSPRSSISSPVSRASESRASVRLPPPPVPAGSSPRVPGYSLTPSGRFVNFSLPPPPAPVSRIPSVLNHNALREMDPPPSSPSAPTAETTSPKKLPLRASLSPKSPLLSLAQLENLAKDTPDDRKCDDNPRPMADEKESTSDETSTNEVPATKDEASSASSRLRMPPLPPPPPRAFAF